jgi:hypothetical protein
MVPLVFSLFCITSNFYSLAKNKILLATLYSLECLETGEKVFPNLCFQFFFKHPHYH